MRALITGWVLLVLAVGLIVGHQSVGEVVCDEGHTLITYQQPYHAQCVSNEYVPPR